MPCNRIENELDEYLDGELPPDRSWELEAHLRYCEACRACLERARELQRLLAALPVNGPTAGFYARAMAAARETAKPAAQEHRTWRVGALAAGVVLLVIGGFLLGSLERSASPVPGVSMAVQETRTVNLVFASGTELEGVSLTVALPDGVELVRYPGQERVRWSTQFRAGRNVLPLELVATGGQGGELVARIGHEGDVKVFTVNVAVTS